MKSSHVRNQYKSLVIWAATPTFSQEKLSNMLIPLLPLAEQKMIVDAQRKLLDVI